MTQPNKRPTRQVRGARGIKINKRRSFRKSMSEALDLFVRNPLTLTRSFWIPAIVAGASLATMVMMPLGIATLLLAIVLLYGVAALAKGVRMLICENLDTATRIISPLPLKAGLTLFLGRSMWAWLLLLIYAIVSGGIVFGLTQLSKEPNSALFIGLCIVICLLLSVPAVLGLSIAVDSPAGGLGALPQGLKLSGKHFGTTLAINFIAIVVLAVLAVLFFLPSYTLGMAQLSSQEAVAFGDPSDLPVSVPVWRIILCVVWGWICAMLSTVWWLTALLHLKSIGAKK